jgi:hypothetical protein
MRDVSVIRLGTARYGDHGRGVKSLGIDVVARALDSCSITRPAIDALFGGNLLSGMLEI